MSTAVLSVPGSSFSWHRYWSWPIIYGYVVYRVLHTLDNVSSFLFVFSFGQLSLCLSLCLLLCPFVSMFVPLSLSLSFCVYCCPFVSIFVPLSLALSVLLLSDSSVRWGLDVDPSLFLSLCLFVSSVFSFSNVICWNRDDFGERDRTIFDDRVSSGQS